MSLLQHIKNAIYALSSNKLRSGLSSLGIIIGIFSVVVLLAIGQGATNEILSNIESLGTNLLTVTPGGSTQTDVRTSASRSSTNVLTLEEAELLAKLPNIKGVSPEYSSRKQIIYMENNMQASVYGVSPEYLTVRNAEVEYGSFITQSHVDKVDKVAVIGAETASTLFGEENPIGKDIRVGSAIMTIVGVMKSKGSTMGMSQDSTVFVPISSAQKRLFGTKYLSSIGISVTNTDVIDDMKEIVQNTLLEHFDIVSMDDANFTVSSLEDALSTVNEITNTMKLFLGAIAAISLLVGGIGVMNIMLVSVTERTREIGIRKAIGAQTKDIILQFLTEAVMLCISGGIIGITLSYLTVFLIKNFVEAVITPQTLILAFGFASIVGLGFGIYPAYQASKLRPIDALRYE